MSGWLALLGTLLNALFDSLTRAFLADRADKDRVKTHEELSVARAADETKDAINDVSQKQADLNARHPDVLDIAHGLRAEADRAAGGRPAVDPLGR